MAIGFHEFVFDNPDGVISDGQRLFGGGQPVFFDGLDERDVCFMVNVFPLGQVLAYQFFEPFRDARAEYGVRVLDVFQYFGAGEGKYGVRDLLAVVV